MMNRSSRQPAPTGNVETGSLKLLSQIGVNPADLVAAAEKTMAQPDETTPSAANWRPLLLSLLAALAVVVLVTAFVLTYLSFRDLRKQVAELKTQKPTVVASNTPTKPPNVTPSSPTVSPTPTNTASPIVTPTPDAPVDFTLTFDPRSIELKYGSNPITVTVSATGSDGSPIANIIVTLSSTGTGELSTHQLTTDSDGKSYFIYTPTLTPGQDQITATSGAATPATLTVYPPRSPSVTLELDPTAFDAGVGEERTVTVTVRGANDQQPARGVPITIVADPLQSVKVKQSSELTTDEQGEVRATLEFQEVATGELRVSAAGDELDTATIRVRPSAVNKSNGAKNLRAEASETSANVGDFAAGSRLPIMGQSSDGSWLQVRTGTGSLAWVKRDVVNVEGDMAQVDVVTPTPAPPTNTSTPAPKPTAAKATATPKPTGYPAEGTHQLVVDKSDNLAPMYRVGGTGEGDILLRMPAHSVTVLAQDKLGTKPPDGFVLVEATVWVDKTKVSENEDIFNLYNPNENVSACWSVVADKCEGVGVLMKNSQWYSVGKIKPEENGNYAKVTVWVWVKRANIQ